MRTVLLGLAASLLAASAFADVRLTMKNGRVSIVARDATVRQILAEWARVGQTKIVNVERIPGGPQTLELNDVTETQALEVLLRPLSGYILAPRAIASANLSTFDRIIIMPTLAGRAAQTTTSSQQQPPAPVLQPPPLVAQPPVEDDEAQAARDSNDDPPVAIVAAPAQANRGPSLNTSPVHSLEVSPQGVVPGGGVPSSAVPQAPVAAPRSPSAPAGGVAVPGMVAPAPQQGQPNQPGQGQPTGGRGQAGRPPGGR